MRFFLFFILVMNLLAFGLYYLDKQKARRGRWRIKEATLLFLGFFGGSVGALLAMQVLRHKTKRWYFWAINALGLLWQLFALYLLYTAGL